MKTENYLKHVRNCSKADMLSFAEDILEFLYGADDGTIDSDQEISGGDFLEFVSDRASLHGLYPDTIRYDMESVIVVGETERNTILAALRHFKETGGLSPEVLKTASEEGLSLDLEEITDLAERIEKD